MSEAIASCGLCSTCSHAPSCTYQRDPKRPVVDCEEFETEVGEPVKLSGLRHAEADSAAQAGRDVVSSGASPGDEDDFARYKGLCGNCEDRRGCTFPKPEGGVWHCEEYR